MHAWAYTTHILSDGHKLNRINQNMFRSFYKFSRLIHALSRVPGCQPISRSTQTPPPPPTMDMGRLCSHNIMRHSGLRAQKPN
jgi:hypothetical protein